MAEETRAGGRLLTTDNKTAPLLHIILRHKSGASK